MKSLHVPLIQKIWRLKYFILVVGCWTLLLAFSVFWNLHENEKDTIGKARVEARTILQHNLAYRRWNSLHGGVYAKVSPSNPPNPYIVDKNRDITTTDGIQLTLINPFQMTKQAYALLRKQSPYLAVINKTVSLNPLNPENYPDEWEHKALLAFDEGKSEVDELTDFMGFPYMRVMAPYYTEKQCLKCHEHQGYSIGDIRGGMSIAVPMEPYYDAASRTRRIINFTHLTLWALGTLAIILFFHGLRRYKQAVTESEEKFRIVSEFAYNFECWVKEGGEFAFISPSCEWITGYSREEFYKNPGLMLEIIHPEDRENFKTHITDFMEPAHEEFEYRIITKDGQIRWVSHACMPIFDKGQFLGRRGSTRDVTDKKRLEEQLFQAQKMECLGHFAGGVAHDFNNVLSSITTFTHLLQDELAESDDDLHEYIDHIIIAAKLGRNLTSNLLAFGRRQISRPKEIHLNELIYNIATIVRSLISEDIKCIISLSKEEIPVFADPHQIEQIVINLCTNARDAMHDGGELLIKTSMILLDKPHAGKFGSIPTGEYMVLTVADTGHGINIRDLNHIFEPFFSTKDSCKGTGLGLSIVANIIKENRAYIDVESSLKKGTTFKVFFPVRATDTDAAASPRQINQGDKSPNAKKTILLVDDDELLRKSLNLLLHHKGYEVIPAVDGDDAIEKFKRYKDSIDLVILDVVLPKKNGKEVYDFIKKDNKDCKVLFISGFTDNILTEKGIKEQGLDFLPKPLDVELFAAKVQSLL